MESPSFFGPHGILRPGVSCVARLAYIKEEANEFIKGGAAAEKRKTDPMCPFPRRPKWGYLFGKPAETLGRKATGLR